VEVVRISALHTRCFYHKKKHYWWRCVPTNCVNLINCTMEKEISYFCATEISFTMFTWPANSFSVVVDTCKLYLNVYLFKIHITTIGSSTNIHPKCCLLFRYSGKSLRFYFLPVRRATASSHLVISTTKCVVTYPLLWVKVFRTFR
jgi:hypothetical protein